MGREGQTKDLRREDIEFGAALNESAIVSRMPKGQFMKMDWNTHRNLELVQNIED